MPKAEVRAAPHAPEHKKRSSPRFRRGENGKSGGKDRRVPERTLFNKQIFRKT